MASKHFRHRHASKSDVDWKKTIYDMLRYDARGSEEVVAVWTLNLPPAAPGNTKEARKAWIAFADELRANARVMEEMHLGLHHDMTPKQNAEMVKDYVERLTKGRCMTMIVIHDNRAAPATETRRAKSDNLHAHVAWMDRDVETRKPVVGTSELKTGGSTRDMRKLWAQVSNEHRELAGLDPVDYGRAPGAKRPRVTQAGLNRIGEKTAYALRCALDQIERMRARMRRLIDIAKDLRAQLREALDRAKRAEAKVKRMERAIGEATVRELELSAKVSELRERDRQRQHAADIEAARRALRAQEEADAQRASRSSSLHQVAQRLNVGEKGPRSL